MSRSVPAADIFDLGQSVFESVEIRHQDSQFPAKIITALIEGPSGLIYFGTQNTLFVFDGYEARRLSYVIDGQINDDALGWIECLRLSPEGDLWIGTYGSGAARFNPETLALQKFRHVATDSNSIAHDRVNDFFFDDKGGIYIATRAGLDYMQIDSGIIQHQSINIPGYSETSVGPLTQDRAGRLWAGLRRSGMAYLDAGESKWHLLSAQGEAAQLLGKNTPRYLFADTSGVLWVGTFGDGLFRISDEEVSQADVPAARVRGIAEPFPGEIWATVMDDGIYVIEQSTGKKMRRYAHDPAVRQSMTMDDLHPLLVDRSGLLWIGSRGAGLIRINTHAQAFRFLHASSGLQIGETGAFTMSSNNPWAGLVRSNERVWISYLSFGIDVIDPTEGVVHRFKIGELGLAEAVRWMLEDSDGRVWVGTETGGVQYYDEIRGRFSALNQIQGPEPGQRINDVRGAIFTAAGNILALSADPYLFNVTEKRWSKVGTDFPADVKKPLFLRALVDGEGDLWASSHFTLVKLKQGTTQLQYLNPVDSEGEPIKPGIYTQLIQGDGNRLYIATTHDLYQIVQVFDGEADDKKYVELKQIVTDQLTDNARLYDGNGIVWSMFERIDLKNNSVEALDLGYGQAVDETWNHGATKTKQGTLVFFSSSMVNLFQPEKFRFWDYEPPVVSRGITIDDKPVLASRNAITLEAAQRRLNVRFAALDYTRPDQNRYRYRLSGYEQTWHETNALQRHATYTNLAPGSYELHIEGSNRLGKWSPKSLKLAVVVMPAWYQRLVFRLLLMFVAVMLIYSMFRLRVWQLELRQVELNKLVALRTQELAEARDQLVAQEKHASLGRLVKGIAHEINTPLSIIRMSFTVFAETMKKLFGEFSKPEPIEASLERLDNKLQQSHDMVEKNLSRVSNLINTFKRAAVDDESLNLSRIDLQAIVRYAVILEAGEADLTPLIIEPRQTPWPSFHSYQPVLQEILLELIRNLRVHGLAGKARPYDGFLLAELHVSDNTNESRVFLQFADFGPGMPEADISKVFDPFFSTRSGTDAIGLGLHIVFNQVTQLLNGEIRCSSGSDGGFYIDIEFPISVTNL